MLHRVIFLQRNCQKDIRLIQLWTKETELQHIVFQNLFKKEDELNFMIEAILRAKIADMREQHNIEPYDGNFENLKVTIEMEYFRRNKSTAPPTDKKHDPSLGLSSFSSRPIPDIHKLRGSVLRP